MKGSKFGMKSCGEIHDEMPFQQSFISPIKYALPGQCMETLINKRVNGYEMPYGF
jgi:hypothetical protein